MHLQRNATQRNAYQNYILLLTNNFKFYILQILGHLNFLSVFFRFAKNQFASLITRGFPKGRRANPLHALAFVYNGLKPHCYSEFAFSYALKNQFEIISQSNYGFCYKNYFFNLNQVFRNNYDFCESFERNSNYDFGRDYNYKNNCDYSFEKNYNFGFGKNDFGNCNFGLGFWNEIYNLKNNLAGFLFNRKINSKKILFQKEKKR